MNEREIIRAAQAGFDTRLHTSEYRKIHSDDEQLNGLLDFFEVEPEKHYLDIGTGNGYVAFSLAREFPEISVTGLDIVPQSIEQNNLMAKRDNLTNVRFETYDGFVYPFPDNTFRGAVSRYAFHHFPDPDRSISEIKRVLGDTGFFILSDPRTYDEDEENFVDRFQRQLPDGHVHFYGRAECEAMFRRFGFSVEKEFESFVRYPRAMNAGYENLFERTSNDILDRYKIEVEENTVHITVSVMNILFRKEAA